MKMKSWPVSLPVNMLYVKNKMPTCFVKYVSTNPRAAMRVPVMVTKRLPYSFTRAPERKPETKQTKCMCAMSRYGRPWCKIPQCREDM